MAIDQIGIDIGVDLGQLDQNLARVNQRLGKFSGDLSRRLFGAGTALGISRALSESVTAGLDRGAEDGIEAFKTALKRIDITGFGELIARLEPGYRERQRILGREIPDLEQRAARQRERAVELGQLRSRIGAMQMDPKADQVQLRTLQDRLANLQSGPTKDLQRQQLEALQDIKRSTEDTARNVASAGAVVLP